MIVKERNRFEPTKSIFAVFGEKEPNATAALAYIIAKFPTVAKQIIHLVIPRISIDFEETEINKERYKKSSGRTDIEIVGEKIHLIFEGKIGIGIPTIEQTTRYVNDRFTGKQRFKKLIFLVNNKEQAEQALKTYESKNKKLSGYLDVLSWADIQSVITRTMRGEQTPHGLLLYEFWNYLKAEVKMKSFEKEVMIVLIKDNFRYDDKLYYPIRGLTSAEAVFDKQIYEGGESRVKPILYLAFKYKGGLKHIARVKKQELVNKSMVFHLDKVLELPIERKVPFAFRQGIQYSSFQRLLDSNRKDFRSIIERDEDKNSGD